MTEITEKYQRKAQPDCMRHIIQHFHYIKSLPTFPTIEQLIRLLVEAARFEKTAATDTIYNAIHDGLLIPIVSSPHGGSPRGRLHESRTVRLPELTEIQNTEHDFYCFECHLPGMLEFCTQCPRSFHRLCYRKDPERPNYTVPSVKSQKNRLPVFNFENSTSEDEFPGHDLAIPDYESDVRASSSLQALDQSSAAATPQNLEEPTVDSTSSPTPAVAFASQFVEGKPPFLMIDDYSTMQYDTKTKLEVVCVGEVRPPNRQRPMAATTNASNVSYKSEVSPSHEDLDLENEMCTCCRLLKSANMRNPPNFEPDELCHLVSYTFSRNRSWLATDAPTYMEALKLSVKECKIITTLMFKIPPQGLEDLAEKLQNNKYTYLMEFLVDVLDIQHNIGVLFGSYSNEMESTKWLVRDIVHDLSEIRRCPDCFRYSHEKRSNIWFAKPCVQRHELVFAKHSGFPYWPAKVIRVLPNNKYDVRFFGGTHSRAPIDVKYIKTIDSDIRTLKLGNSQAIKKAMEELRYHQVLSTYPPSKFSFHANKEETENIIRDVLGRDQIGKSRRTRKRKVTATVIHAEENSGNSVEATYEENSMQLRARKYKPETSPTKRVTRSADAVKKYSDIEKTHEELKEAIKIAETHKRKYDKISAQMLKLKETIKKYEIEKKILKRKQWCYWCLNEAIYLCCFKAAYCSEICQARHWRDGHNEVCTNKQQTENTSATSTT